VTMWASGTDDGKYYHYNICFNFVRLFEHDQKLNNPLK